MSARDDYKVLAWHADGHEITRLGEQCARALDEIDKLRRFVSIDEWTTNEFGLASVRDALRERIGNTLVERYVADILGIDINVSVADVQRWMHNGPKWDHLLARSMELSATGALMDATIEDD